MQYQYKFEKIMSLRTREKDEAQSVYQDAVRKFEEAADHLYQLLKKKEVLESHQSEKLSKGLAVSEIRHHQQFIGNLEKTIDYYQKMVINARNRMNYQHSQLMEKNIEVKKYQKIKEKDYLDYLTIEKEEENKVMDEISIQQFMSRGN
ncbi:flagellar export protein FliJ [Mesobacillus foraminis]|uniref:flagellar export protein FliJ n=1 Tax=Mesobacillus foraminis TaxID=279826 RepID=UPI000EF4F44D|nr:flagellar export protein FliJ [Mesobacillus foraminis]MBT2756014.1 flagellar biosynthesis chaperone FliJ [Mesobacillus foraminis]